MYEREMMPTGIMDKYKEDICFIVNTNTCRLHAIQPITYWGLLMGYELDGCSVSPHVYELFSKYIDVNIIRFDSYEETYIKIHF